MATTQSKSSSMKNKSKMWGGDKATQPKKSSSASKSGSAKSKSGSSKASVKKSGSASAATKKGDKNMKYKSEFASDMTVLNDVEIISDVLSSHKGLVKLYGTALCESSCENMRDLVAQNLTECGEDQYDVFLYMSERNLYPTEDATQQKITKAKEKFKKYEQEMKI